MWTAPVDCIEFYVSRNSYTSTRTRTRMNVKAPLVGFMGWQGGWQKVPNKKGPTLWMAYVHAHDGHAQKVRISANPWTGASFSIVILKQVSRVVTFISPIIAFAVIALTLTFELWPWKPFHQSSLTRWIFLASFIKIHPLSTEIPRVARNKCYNGRRTDGQTQHPTAYTVGRGDIKIFLKVASESKVSKVFPKPHGPMGRRWSPFPYNSPQPDTSLHCEVTNTRLVYRDSNPRLLVASPTLYRDATTPPKLTRQSKNRIPQFYRGSNAAYTFWVRESHWATCWLKTAQR